MNSRSWRLWIMAAGAAGALGVASLGGCEQGSGRSSDSTWYDESDPHLRERQAQAAQTEREQPLATTRDRSPEVRVEDRQSQGRRSGAYRPSNAANTSVASMAYPTGDEATSVLLIQEVLPREVRVNQPFDYEIHVTNLTSNTLNNVIVESEGAQNLSITGSTPQGQNGSGGSMQWAIGELGPHETEIITVNAKAERVGAATNCINASYSNTLCAGTQVTQPAITLARTVPTEALACEPIAIRYEVRNTGTGTAANVRVRDTLPAGLTTTEGRNTVDVDAGTLAAGQSKVVTVNVKAAKPGRYEGGVARAEGADGLAAEAPAGAIVVRQPVLTLEADCGEGALLGRNATLRFTVTNTGDAPANNTVIRANLPQGTQFVGADNSGSGSGTSASWNLGTIRPGESRTVSLQARSSTAGTLRTSARATAQCATEVTANCESTVQGVPDIGTLLSDDEGVVQVGNNHVYTMEVENQGQVDLTNTKLVFTMPEGMTLVSAQGTAPPAVSGTTATFNLGTLRPREKKAFKVTVKSTRAGEFRVSSDITADQIKQPLHQDEITVFVDR